MGMVATLRVRRKARLLSNEAAKVATQLVDHLRGSARFGRTGLGSETRVLDAPSSPTI
jgi:hypothetical protein